MWFIWPSRAKQTEAQAGLHLSPAQPSRAAQAASPLSGAVVTMSVSESPRLEGHRSRAAYTAAATAVSASDPPDMMAFPTWAMASSVSTYVHSVWASSCNNENKMGKY